jgi:hypothetical protein
VILVQSACSNHRTDDVTRKILPLTIRRRSSSSLLDSLPTTNSAVKWVRAYIFPMMRPRPASSLQKTYDECYLACSTAVYFEGKVGCFIPPKKPSPDRAGQHGHSLMTSEQRRGSIEVLEIRP